MLRQCIILSLFTLVSRFAVAADQVNCPFSEKVFDKVKVINELDRQTGECIFTVAPTLTADGDYQIYSFSPKKISHLKSDNLVSSEKLQEVGLANLSLSGLPDLQFVKSTRQLLVSWQKSWILISTDNNQLLASNIPQTKSLTRR